MHHLGDRMLWRHHTVMVMESCSRNRTVIDVNEVIKKHEKIMQNLAAHAPTGCNTVSCFAGIEKTSDLLLLIVSTLSRCTCFIHNWTQSLALSLKSARSLVSHSCSSRGHLSRCSMVCGSLPHSQVTSYVSRYPHFFRVTLQRPVPDLNPLRHFHSAQLNSAPGGSSSLALMDMVVVGRLAIISSHKATLVLFSSIGLNFVEEAFPGFEPSLCWFVAE